MLSPEHLHKYQDRGVQHVLDHRDSMLHLDMGLGKTIITLTAVKWLMATGQADRVLVVAPLRVCQTVWKQEADNWTHTRGLKFSYVLGSEKKRTRGLFAKADIYLINYENLVWLSGILQHYYRPWNFPFDVIVWDEVSKMKASTSERAKYFRPLVSWFKYRIGLTGTPASNGLLDLHGQYLVVDQGLRLTPHITHFKNRWFFKEAYGYKYLPFPNSQKLIAREVADITLNMKAEDYIEVPEFNTQDIWITLSAKHYTVYQQLEEEFFIELETAEVTVLSAAALSNKCRQFCNGNVYYDSPKYEVVHKLKLNALAEIVEETGDSPLLVAYAFKADLAEILKAYPEAVNLSGLQGAALQSAVDAWNAGKIKIMVGHPASMGHGLNLQAGGHRLVWFGLNWSLDLYEQFNARVHRQGQQHPVFCHRIMVKDTIEVALLNALESKAATQTELRQTIENYRGNK